MHVNELSFFLKIFYASMALVVISLMVFYAKGLTSKRAEFNKNPKYIFYGWIVLLIGIAVLFHILTAWKIPWVNWEINRGNMKFSKEIIISMNQHKFILPKDPIIIKKDEIVKFKVASSDLTYGFGVFQKSGAIEFQMQVLPGHSNDIIWIFKKAGRYSIRSTEYAGPETLNMYLKDVIKVLPDKGDKR